MFILFLYIAFSPVALTVFCLFDAGRLCVLSKLMMLTFPTEIRSPYVQCTCCRLRLQRPLCCTALVERSSARCSSLRLLAHTHACVFASFSVLTPSSAAACVKSINLSDNLLTSTIAAELQQHLQRFPALQRVNMSGNPFLGTAGVTEIVSSIGGA